MSDEKTVAASMSGLSFHDMLAGWEVRAKRAKYLLAIADRLENEALLQADAKNSEGRKAQAELASYEQRIAADYAEIEAQAAFILVRREQWRESQLNVEVNTAATYPGQGMGDPFEEATDPFEQPSEPFPSDPFEQAPGRVPSEGLRTDCRRVDARDW